jgi:hypothetical protein
MYFVDGFKRVLIAAAMAACAAQPIVLDACSAACDRARTVRNAAAPPCHHEATPAEQISQPVRACGQDHAVVPASGTSSPDHVQTIALVNPCAFASGLAPRRAPLPFGSQSPPPSRFLESHTALRI